jgi:hypothetical protein
MVFSSLEFIAFAFGIAYIAYMAVMTDQYRRLQDSAFFRSQLTLGGVLAGLWLFLGVAFLPLLMPISFLLLYKIADWASYVYRHRHLVMVNHLSIAEGSSVKVGISDVLLTAFVLVGASLGVPYLLNMLLGWA